jgi:hypothetical protein
MLNALDTLVSNGLSDDALNAVIADLLKGDSIEDDDEKRCLIAVAWHREQGNNTGPTDCSVEYGDVIKVGGEEYRVLDESDKETAWGDSLENYLDECVEGSNGPYFDRDKWKRDARIDGAGQALSSYDGEENEFRTDGDEWWFLYRVN